MSRVCPQQPADHPDHHRCSRWDDKRSGAQERRHTMDKARGHVHTVPGWFIFKVRTRIAESFQSATELLIFPCLLQDVKVSNHTTVGVIDYQCHRGLRFKYVRKDCDTVSAEFPLISPYRLGPLASREAPLKIENTQVVGQIKEQEKCVKRVVDGFKRSPSPRPI